MKRIYPFEKFDRQVSELDSHPQKGGLLMIHHTQYIFGETSVANRYEPLSGVEQEKDENPKFNRNSQRVENFVAQGSIFIKKRDKN